MSKLLFIIMNVMTIKIIIITIIVIIKANLMFINENFPLI